jgi:hypothetical protein
LTCTARSPGAVCVLQCDPGFKVTGGDALRQCQSNLQWSGTAATCALDMSCDPSPCASGAVCVLDSLLEAGYVCQCDEARGFYAKTPGVRGEHCVQNSITSSEEGLAITTGVDVKLHTGDGVRLWSEVVDDVDEHAESLGNLHVAMGAMVEMQEENELASLSRDAVLRGLDCAAGSATVCANRKKIVEHDGKITVLEQMDVAIKSQIHALQAEADAYTLAVANNFTMFKELHTALAEAHGDHKDTVAELFDDVEEKFAELEAYNQDECENGRPTDFGSWTYAGGVCTFTPKAEVAFLVAAARDTVLNTKDVLVELNTVGLWQSWFKAGFVSPGFKDGRFTAPQNGLYAFSVRAGVSAPADANVCAYLTLNNAPAKAAGLHACSAAGHVPASVAGVLRLVQGDVVGFYVSSTSAPYTILSSSTFSGALINPDVQAPSAHVLRPTNQAMSATGWRDVTGLATTANAATFNRDMVSSGQLTASVGGFYYVACNVHVSGAETGEVFAAITVKRGTSAFVAHQTSLDMRGQEQAHTLSVTGFVYLAKDSVAALQVNMPTDSTYTVLANTDCSAVQLAVTNETMHGVIAHLRAPAANAQAPTVFTRVGNWTLDAAAASFNSGDFDVSTGDLHIKAGNEGLYHVAVNTKVTYDMTSSPAIEIRKNGASNPGLQAGVGRSSGGGSNVDETILGKVNPNVKWSLCYRRSVHGASSSTFHNRCDSRGATVTIIRNNRGRYFGGYSPRSWFIDYQVCLVVTSWKSPSCCTCCSWRWLTSPGLSVEPRCVCLSL